MHSGFFIFACFLFSSSYMSGDDTGCNSSSMKILCCVTRLHVPSTKTVAVSSAPDSLHDVLVRLIQMIDDHVKHRVDHVAVSLDTKDTEIKD